MDGAQIRLKSVKVGRYVCAEAGGGSNVVVDRNEASDWETFTLWQMEENYFSLRTFNKQFLGVEQNNNEMRLVAHLNKLGQPEKFELVWKDDDENRVRIRTSNGLYLQVNSVEGVTVDKPTGGWGDDDSSVFVITIFRFEDGAKLCLKSVKFGQYLCAENGGGNYVLANRAVPSDWEKFHLWRVNKTAFSFKVHNQQFMGLEDAKLVAKENTPIESGSFQIVRNKDDRDQVRLRASNGYFLQVKDGGLVTADFDGDGQWGDNDPSVFVITILSYKEHPSFKIRAVNLGGWLVTEGWIKPSLFDGITNKDLLDGTEVQFKSVKLGTYLCAENGGQGDIVANREVASDWETFRLWRFNEQTFSFRMSNQKKIFMGLENGIKLVTLQDITERFEIVRNRDNHQRVRIRAPNGSFLQVKSPELVTADYGGNGGWEDDDPSVFMMSIGRTFQGEFQVTNGYGPERASEVMQEHWSTFIVEEDFKFMSANGLNAVRIPVGWWIAKDPTPPKPYVAGSLNALDNAFKWALKYGLKVIVDLHAAPGSQNSWDHSSTRDGYAEWGKTPENISETAAVIEFLSARYGNHPCLYAVELLNEPSFPEVPADTLKHYYAAGYNAVRKYSSTAYVVMSNWVVPPNDPMEIVQFASGFKRTVIDAHYYNLFYDQTFKPMTAQQNIDFFYTTRFAQLDSLNNSDGALAFVGEWVAEWERREASKEDYQKFARAQLDVLGRASFGWAYWTLKCEGNHWSLEWMIKNGYINLL